MKPEDKELIKRAYCTYAPYDMQLIEDGKLRPLIMGELPANILLGQNKVCKLVLKPLSDLKKGNNIDVINPELRGNLMDSFIHDIELGFVTWNHMETLFKHHYDVSGLIEKGFAVDINEIK